MVRACEALSGIDAKYGVWYCSGNHDDDSFGRDFSSEELVRELEKNGVHILADETAYVGGLCIAGRRDASFRGRMEISELLDGVDTDKYIIVLDHQPNDYEKESRTAADLVLSGHTHGGQLIPITGPSTSRPGRSPSMSSSSSREDECGFYDFRQAVYRGRNCVSCRR